MKIEEKEAFIREKAVENSSSPTKEKVRMIESLLLLFIDLIKRGGRMTGKPEKKDKKICPLCGGQLREGLATIPFVLDSVVAVVKDVPAEVCSECDEPYMKGDAVDRIDELLDNLENMAVEVSVTHYKKAA